MQNITISIGSKEVTLALGVEDTQVATANLPFNRTQVQVAADVTVDGKALGGILFQTDDDDTSDLVANVLTPEVEGDASEALYAMCFPDADADEDSDERAAFHAAFEPAAVIATAMHREYVRAALLEAA